jgi:hypothetical protein
MIKFCFSDHSDVSHSWPSCDHAAHNHYSTCMAYLIRKNFLRLLVNDTVPTLLMQINRGSKIFLFAERPC